MRTWLRALGCAAALCLCGAVSGCAFVVANLNPFAAAPEKLREQVVQGEGPAKILLLDVSGVITAQERSRTLGLQREESTVARVAEELERAKTDTRVKAVVVRINSPGGAVTASDTIYHLIRAFASQRALPVVAQVLDLGTSGGYYVALAADEIVASPTTITGGIGVVLLNLNLEGLLDKIGIKDQTLKAGPHKDIGSPFRTMPDEERQILQAVLDHLQARFLGLVAERRPGAGGAARAAATDGRILTAEQALRAGLIDRIGYLDDAIAHARRRAGVTEARVVIYRRPEEFSATVFSKAAGDPPQLNLVNFDLGDLTGRTPQFMYLWAP